MEKAVNIGMFMLHVLPAVCRLTKQEAAKTLIDGYVLDMAKIGILIELSENNQFMTVHYHDTFICKVDVNEHYEVYTRR